MTSGAYVSGAGIVSPAGSDLDTFWTTVRAAEFTHAELIDFPELDGINVLGCRARGFEPSSRLERHELRRLDRSHQMAFWASDDALADAGDGPSPERCAVVVGTGFGAAGFQEQQHQAFTNRGFRGLSPLGIPVVMPNSIAGHLSIRYGFQGPSITVASACASGANAIGEALWLIRSGRADRVLAGGVDSLLTVGVAASFARMEAMSTRTDDPGTSSRPFDAGRDGFVLGEGAGFVVLDRDPRSNSLGSIRGYATNSDAHHIAAPVSQGAGAAACMTAALLDAGIRADEVGHVNAHGTSTSLNDAAEAHAIANVFGPGSVRTTSTKAVIGHLIGAAGAVEIIASLLAVRKGIVPGTANLANPDPEIAALIDVGPEHVDSPAPLAVSNSFGFGGHNATVAVS